MKIQTTDAVRRFNAQVELVDLALEFAASQLSDPGALVRLLELAGHRDLGKTFQESMRQVCITGSGWPGARPGREPGQPPDKAAASSPTKSAIPNCPNCNGERELDGAGGYVCYFCGMSTPPDYIIEDNKRIAKEAYSLWERDQLRIACTAALEEMRAFRQYWTSPKMNMARTKCRAEELCETALDL